MTVEHDHPGHAPVDLAGESALLLPEKAIYLIESKTLVVADVHIGKTASFRSRAFFAPDGVTARDLDMLTFLITALGARRLIVLGDLVHARDGLTVEEIQLFDDFRQKHRDIDIVLVLGNHDHRSGVPSAWQIELVHGDMHEGPFTFSHEYSVKAHGRGRSASTVKKAKVGYVLSGHIHPSVMLRGKGRQKERLPCFWVRDHYAVLPSFGVFTGSFTIRPSQLDKVFVVARDIVLPMER